MLIEKTKAVKAYTYRMLLIFKTPVTYKKKLTSRWATSSDISRFFAGQYPISGANVQACFRHLLPKIIFCGC